MFWRRSKHERYRFINRDLLNKTYEDGDVYDQSALERARTEWENPPE
jgi:hypothetical protein